ncbi:hypothetical protein ACSBR2_005250 [Camellia fascicularis]
MRDKKMNVLVDVLVYTLPLSPYHSMPRFLKRYLDTESIFHLYSGFSTYMFLYVTMSMRGIGGPVLGDIRLIWTTFVVPLDGISALTLVFALPLSFMGIQ